MFWTSSRSALGTKGGQILYWLNDTHREKLCFTQFNTRIYLNKSLAVHFFEQSIKFYTFHYRICLNRWLNKVIHQIGCSFQQILDLNLKLDPKIGNQNHWILHNWYTRLKDFSIILKKDIVKFCDIIMQEIGSLKEH